MRSSKAMLSISEARIMDSSINLDLIPASMPSHKTKNSPIKGDPAHHSILNIGSDDVHQKRRENDKF